MIVSVTKNHGTSANSLNVGFEIRHVLCAVKMISYGLEHDWI